MTPLRGWGPKGRRLVAKAPHGHWKTLAFLAALRSDRIDAPCVLDGPINGKSFAAYIKQMLVPTLSPGEIVIMDNPGSHKGPAIRKAIREAGRMSQQVVNRDLARGRHQRETGARRIVELQATAEQEPFDEAQLKKMMEYAAKGIDSLIAKQQSLLQRLLLRQ